MKKIALRYGRLIKRAAVFLAAMGMILLQSGMQMTVLAEDDLQDKALDTISFFPQNMVDIYPVDADGKQLADTTITLKDKDTGAEFYWNGRDAYPYKISGTSTIQPLSDRSIYAMKKRIKTLADDYIGDKLTTQLVYRIYDDGSLSTPWFNLYDSDNRDMSSSFLLNWGESYKFSLGYVKENPSTMTIPAGCIMIRPDDKVQRGYARLNGTMNYMFNQNRNVTIPIGAGFYAIDNSTQTFMKVSDKETTYEKVKVKVSEIPCLKYVTDSGDWYNYDGRWLGNIFDQNDIHTRFVIYSGAMISSPLPDADGYLNFYVDSKTHLIHVAMEAGYASAGLGSSYATNQKWVKIKMPKLPSPKGACFYSIPAGTYEVKTSGSDHYVYGTQTIKVVKSDTMQKIPIVLECKHKSTTGYQSGSVNHWKICDYCGEKFNKAEHVPGEPATETHDQKCTVCKYVMHDKLDHETVRVAKVEPTCTKDGKKAYYTCKNCTNLFSDKEATKKITDESTLIIEKLGHDWGEHDFDENGHWKVCNRCGKNASTYTHKPGPEATESAPQVCTVCGYIMVPQLTHKLTKVAAKAATCLKKGNIQYYTCQNCDDYFLDSKATKKIEDKTTIVIKALGHSYGEWESDETDHFRVCERAQDDTETEAHKPGPAATESAPQVCVVCKYVLHEKLQHELTRVEQELATCTTDGQKAYYTCKNCDNWYWDAQAMQPVMDKNAILDPASGHDYKCYNNESSHWMQCSRCQEVVQKGNHVYSSSQDATCDRCTFIRKVDESRLNGNQLEKRDDLSYLLVKGSQSKKDAVTLKWSKDKSVSGYEVYWSYCNGKQDFKLLKRTKANRYTHKKLKTDKSYKYFVVAYKKVQGKKVYLTKTPVIHIAMKEHGRTNIKSIVLSKAKVSLAKGKSYQIKASYTKQNKKAKVLNHAAILRYKSSNTGVATVSKKGKVLAKGMGTCEIYIFAENGVTKNLKVDVTK